MKSKKSKSADLSRDRSNYLLIGVVIATAFTLMAFEWSTFSGHLKAEVTTEDINEDFPFKERPLHIIKPTLPKPQKKIEPNRKDIVDEKTEEEVIQPLKPIEMDTTHFVEVNIVDNDEDKGEIDIEPIFVGSKTAELGDPDVHIPYYDMCKSATYEEKLTCISGQIHETLMDGLKNLSADEIARNKSDKMYVLFVISKEGTITDIVIPHESNFQKGVVQKVKATMTDVPVMHPATKFGKKVAINFSIPIRFSSH